MKRIIYIISAVLILISLLACSDLTSSDRFDGETYVISGLLIAGKSVSLTDPVYVCKSTSINDFNAQELFVGDAEVKIFEITNNVSTHTIELEPEVDMDMDADVPMPKVKYVDNTNYIIKADQLYRIEVRVNEQLITAETMVPKATTLNLNYFDLAEGDFGYDTDPNTTKKMTPSQIDTMYPLALNMGDYEGTQNFRAEFFCREEFSTDLEFVTPFFGFEHPDENMRDGYYSSGESIRKISFMGKYNAMHQPEHPDSYLMIRDYKQVYVFYGKYRIKAYIVDDNYYNYSFMPEGYLYGGVNNGLGYFGSASGGIMYTEIVREDEAK